MIKEPISVLSSKVLTLTAACILGGAGMTFAQTGDGVKVVEDERLFVLSNGLLTAKVSKSSGDLVSLTYKGVETLSAASGHPFVYWSHDVRGATEIQTRVTIDPTSNRNERAEVSIKGISGGKLMGHGPGTPPEGDMPVDIDIRYALGQGDRGLYTYCIFEHPPEYGAGDMAEARIAAKLQPFFDHIHIDDARSGPYPLLDEGIDKYVYTALQAKHRAYGFTSPERQLGWFMIVPSAEFLSGGPMKAEFLAHGTSPTVLCYWKSSHYGGANITLAAGERWTRVVGPMLLYINEGSSSDAMWDDARARLKREESIWPYDWVSCDGYAPHASRSEVRGRFIVDDPLGQTSGQTSMPVTVGLTKTPYRISVNEEERVITWQNDAKYYQHWVRTEDPSGSFAIPSVPTGTYNLVAFASGVSGEFRKTNVVVARGENLDLGEIVWRPERDGHQVWQIGVPDRTATDFAGAEEHFWPGSPLRFAERFPADLDFVIGQSDPTDDWYYAHMPYADAADARILPFRGVSGDGSAASRTVRFELEDNPEGGRAVLSIAVTGTGARPELGLSVNGESAGTIKFGRNDGALVRHQIHGVWREVKTEFDATLLKQGDNRLTLTAPAGSLNTGVIYDYLRLELAKSGSP